MRYKNGKRWTLDRRKYAGMLTAADESLQTVINALKKQNMWNDTIVVYQTDNGGSRKAVSQVKQTSVLCILKHGLSSQENGFICNSIPRKLPPISVLTHATFSFVPVVQLSEKRLEV